MAMPTTEKLAQALHGRGLLEMEADARAGRYDDFKSEYPTPCIDLVRDLRAAGYDDLADRASAGEWDSTKEESDAWEASGAKLAERWTWVVPGSSRKARYDRIWGSGVRFRDFRCIGRDAVTPDGQPPSDHYGVVTTVRPA